MIISFLILSIIMFLNLIKYLIILEVIISWLVIFWIVIKIQFIQNITMPLYNYIKKILPTTFWMIDFTPIIVIIWIEVIISILVSIFPEALTILQNFL